MVVSVLKASVFLVPVCACICIIFTYLCIRKQNKNKTRNSSKGGIIKILNVIKLYLKIIIATHYFELNSRTYCQI